MTLETKSASTLTGKFAGRMRLSVTNVFVIINALYFAAMIALDGWSALYEPSKNTLIELGANFAPLTAGGEPWRLLACAFLHSGSLHFLVNMYVLFVLGHDVEEDIGWWRYLLLYLALALFASVTSLGFTDIGAVCVGASGAVCGLLGFATGRIGDNEGLPMRDIIKRRLLILIFFIAILLYQSFLMPYIDNAAHLGGLFAGVAAGVTYGLARRSGHQWLTLSGPLVVALLSLGIFHLEEAELSKDPRLAGHREFIRAVKLLKKEEYARSLPLFDEAVKMVPDDPRVRLNRARALLELKKYELALADLSVAEKNLPDETMVPVMKSMVLHSMGRYQEAKKEIRIALARAPGDGQLYNNLAWTQVASGELDGALANVNRSLRDGPAYAALDTRAVIYILQGKTEDALNDLNTAINLQPASSAAYFHRAALSNLKGDDFLTDKDLRLAVEYGYDPEPWEKDRFGTLDARFESMKRTTK
ncbi:MAG: rhomboid family intramembrane serine protease [Candidatus Melainabacteria bacterium]|nr:rhomboid family intramembrane serine protease [Candidatus Melainabacteria bacterium]